MHYRDESRIKEILDFLNIKNIEDIYSPYIDKDFLNPNFDYQSHDFINHDGKNEFEVNEEIKGIASKNKLYSSFLGAGVYQHYIPSIVENLSSRSEFLTSYTPYQAEASQGTLQYIFEYQTLICDLLQMDVTNASHYDCSVSSAEAIRLAYYYFNKQKTKAIVSSEVNPEYIKVIKTYCKDIGIRLVFADFDEIESLICEQTACVFIQNPNFFGQIKDLESLSKKIHEKDSLFIMATDLIFAVNFKTPGDLDCDIAIAEGQVLGIPPSFGGPFLGVFSSKEKFLRKLPGRLSGETIDADGKRGFVLTLSTREQHIRREKSLSNICTNQSLMALKALIYLSYMGKESLKEVSFDCFYKINYLKEKIAKIKGFYVDENVLNFNDLLVTTDYDISELFLYFKESKIILGLPLSKYYQDRKNQFLISVTEKKSLQEIDDLVLKLECFK